MTKLHSHVPLKTDMVSNYSKYIVIYTIGIFLGILIDILKLICSNKLNCILVG